MKKSAFILVILIAMFVVVGCGSGGGGVGGIIDESLGTRDFWAQNAVTGTFYRINADKLAENSICEVWAEKGSGVTAATARSIAGEYTNNIYTKMIGAFGWSENVKLQNKQIKKMNTMEFAHYLATGETSSAKLTILLLDIKDGYQTGVNESYVAGYFYQYDIFYSSLPLGYRSNKLDMIYIDTNPGLINSEKISEAYMTLAHEMQHLMNFVSSIAYRVKSNTIYAMDTWIDEGLSSAAEWLYLGRHNDSKVGWFTFNGDGKSINGKIDVGNNFYVWNNRVTEADPYPILDDYATVYLFFQWLRLQTNANIYKEIIKSEDYDNKAVINAFNNITSPAYSSWESMLRDWLAANNTPSAAGRNCYKSDAALKDIKVSYAPLSLTSLDLYPGEGVYSYSASSPSVTPLGSIKYEYFSGTKTLLTYNENPVNNVKDITSLIETGTTTGLKPPASIVVSGNFNLKLGSSGISGPFPIGMGDVISFNKNTNRFNLDMTKFERVFIDE